MKSKRTKELFLEGKMETRNSNISLPSVGKFYNREERNTFLFGWTPQAELWNGRLAMIGFLAYLIWDFAGYNVLYDVVRLIG